MTDVQRYSVLVANASQSQPAADFGAVPINFSGATGANGNTSAFTVAGWVRIPSGTDVELFSAFGQFSITTQNGVVSTLLTGGTAIDSSISIADGTWHYVAVAFEQLDPRSPTAGGALRLYIDGGLFDDATVGPSSASATGTCQVGVSVTGTGTVDFASWTFYSTAACGDVLDVPGWGEPPHGSPDARGLVAAWDFAGGAARDLAPNPGHFSVTVGPLFWCTDCTQAPYSVGISARPFRRRKPFTASSMPAATQRSIICPPRHRFTFRFT